MRWALGLGVTFLAPWKSARAATGALGFYIPGNHQPDLSVEGQPIAEHPRFAKAMRPFTGHPTILTRVDDNLRVTKVLLPVAGHDVEIRPDQRSAVCNGQNATTMCTFDPVTLEMGQFLEYPSGTIGGGHSVYLVDELNQAVTERVTHVRWSGLAKNHHGSIAIRDNDTLQLIERYSSGGILPHEVRLLEDGKHIAVANYGSTKWPEGSTGYDRYIVEPCLNLIELSSGKIVEQFLGEPATAEFRHLSAYNRERIFVLQNAQMSIGAFHSLMSEKTEPYRTFKQKTEFTAGAPLPLLHFDFDRPEGPRRDLTCENLADMTRGQSVEYDPIHDEAIASFPQSGTIIAFSGKTGAAKVIDCTSLGLTHPRGVAMHPDGKHYGVAGDAANLFVFERGTHRLVRERCSYTAMHRHSHMAAG